MKSGGLVECPPIRSIRLSRTLTPNRTMSWIQSRTKWCESSSPSYESVTTARGLAFPIMSFSNRFVLITAGASQHPLFCSNHSSNAVAAACNVLITPPFVRPLTKYGYGSPSRWPLSIRVLVNLNSSHTALRCLFSILTSCI